MKLWVTGSQDWDNDMILARAITLAIQEMSEDDNQIHFLHLDREGAEQMAGSYVAKTKAFLTGKGFKVSEFIPNKSASLEERIQKVLDQSPDFMLLFNKGADYKAGKIRESAQSNKIRVIEYKNA